MVLHMSFQLSTPPLCFQCNHHVSVSYCVRSIMCAIGNLLWISLIFYWIQVFSWELTFRTYNSYRKGRSFILWCTYSSRGEPSAFLKFRRPPDIASFSVSHSKIGGCADENLKSNIVDIVKGAEGMQASWHLLRNVTVSAGMGYKIGPDGRRVRVDRFEYRRIPRDMVRDIARCWLGGGCKRAGERWMWRARVQRQTRLRKRENAREKGDGGKREGKK